ncbi:MAG: mechanosensitive ion channel family protein [Firmicutes bacterium]|nr:mechanosensitive ion channel family protein [Bacillota bacterium]
MDILNDIQTLISYFIVKDNLLRIIGAIIVLVMFITFRYIFMRIVLNLISRLLNRINKKFSNTVTGLIDKPMKFIIVVIGVSIAVKILKLPEGVSNFTDRVLSSLIAFSILWALYRIVDAVTAFIKNTLGSSENKIDQMLFPFIRNGLKTIVVVIGSITILQQWTDNIAGLLTGLGIGGLAFALAAKDTVANMFGSLTIMLDRPFKVGDWIMTPKVEGTVEDIGFRSTKIRTFEQSVVTIPNSVISDDTITNWSRMGKRRVKFILGITYDTNIEKMEECLKRLRAMLKSHADVHPDVIYVNFYNFGDSALEILIYYFTKATDYQSYLNVKEDVNLKIMGILDELGLSVAFPSRSIYIESNKDGLGKDLQ